MLHFHPSREPRSKPRDDGLEYDPVRTMHRHLKWALGAASGALLASIVTTIAMVDHGQYDTRTVPIAAIGTTNALAGAMKAEKTVAVREAHPMKSRQQTIGG